MIPIILAASAVANIASAMVILTLLGVIRGQDADFNELAARTET